jgi:hypothetical protein
MIHEARQQKRMGIAGNIRQMPQYRRADSVWRSANKWRDDRVEERPENKWLHQPAPIRPGKRQMVRVPAPRVHEEEARHEKKTWHCKSADLIENPELLT